MKRKLFLLLGLLCVLLPLGAQNHQHPIRDTAEEVVRRYHAMMVTDRLPADSLLFGRTLVYGIGSTDTLVMLRWFTAAGAMRVEEYWADTLVFGIYTDGDQRYRQFSPLDQWWNDLTPKTFDFVGSGFDYRPPLTHWRTNGTTLTYCGTYTDRGVEMQVVQADRPVYPTRRYFFEQRSGLLTLLREADTTADGSPVHIGNSVDLKFFHSYSPVGSMLLPTQESYVRQWGVTVLETEWKLLPLQPQIFDRDRWKTTTSDL